MDIMDEPVITEAAPGEPLLELTVFALAVGVGIWLAFHYAFSGQPTSAAIVGAVTGLLGLLGALTLGRA